MLPAKYQPNRPGGLGEESSKWSLPYMGMVAIFEFRIMTFLAIFYITVM